MDIFVYEECWSVSGLLYDYVKRTNSVVFTKLRSMENHLLTFSFILDERNVQYCVMPGFHLNLVLYQRW